MNVRQLIAEPLIVNKVCKDKKEIEARVDAMMETVGLARRLAGAYPHELDGGRRQRIGIGRALIMERPLSYVTSRCRHWMYRYRHRF